MISQGGSSEASQRRPLSRSHWQAIMALIAAIAINDVPLDLVLTDGKEYEILRFQDDLLLEYENLIGREVGAKAITTAFHCTALDAMLA